MSGDGEVSVGDPLDGSLDALARRIETIVQQTVEGSTAQAGTEAPTDDPLANWTTPLDDTDLPEGRESAQRQRGEPVVEAKPSSLRPKESAPRDTPTSSHRSKRTARSDALDELGTLTEDLGRAFKTVDPGAAGSHVGTASETEVPAVSSLLEGQDRPRAAPQPDPAGALDSATPPLLVRGGVALAQQVIEALRRGERAKAAELFCELTGLTAGEVDRMLSHPDGEVLAAACRSLGMEQLQFVSLLLLARKTSSPMETVHAADLKQILEVFAEMSMDRAQELLRAWRLGVGS